jgi:hypothetical protein
VSESEIVRLVALLGVAILVVPAALRLNRSGGRTLRFVAIWLALAVALALAYRWLG